MPTIPLIQDSAQLDTGTGRQRISADANAFGALEARGAQAVSQGLQAVAGAASEIDDDFNEANARDLDNQLNQFAMQRLSDPEKGYLSQRGVNAIDGRAAAEEEIDAYAAELANNARNPRARALYQDVARRRVTTALGAIAEHAARETRAYQDDVSESAVRLATDNAVAGFADPVNVETNLRTADAEVARVGARNGWSPDVIADRQRRVRSDITSRVIVQLSTTDPAEAERYYELARETLTAQDAAELRTSMRVAQAAARERVTGMAWQAFANGQSLEEGMGAEAYQEFTTNPLYGQDHAQLRNAIRVRQQSYAEGGRVRDNSPAFIAALLASDQTPEEFTRPGQLEAYLSAHAGDLSPGDMVRLLSRRREMSSGEGSSAASQQSARYNALRNLSSAALLPYGLDLSDDEDDRTRAFEAALLAAAQSSEPGEDPQITIGRAIVGMQDSSLQNLPQFRVEGNRGREGDPGERGGGRRRGTAVAPSSEAVVPYSAIPEASRLRIGTALQNRLRRVPTQGEVENAYAAYLQGRSLEEVLR